MALSKGDYIRPARKFWAGAVPMLTAAELASQTFKKGYPLIQSSGYLKIAASSAIDVIGIALEDGSNGSSNGDYNVQYVPALPGMIFEGAVTHSTASSAKITQANLFVAYGLVKSSSNNIYAINLSESSASEKSVTIVGFKDALSTAYGHAYFVFNAIGRDEVWK